MSNPETWEDALDAVLAEMRDIMVERQNKYGPSNIRDQGLYGVVTRAVADKIARILTALNGRLVHGKVVLDPVLDTEAQDTFEDGLIDAANYLGPIALMVYRGWWDLPRSGVTGDVTVPTVTCEDMGSLHSCNGDDRNGLVLPPTAIASSSASNAAASSAREEVDCPCGFVGCDPHDHINLGAGWACGSHFHRRGL